MLNSTLDGQEIAQESLKDSGFPVPHGRLEFFEVPCFYFVIFSILAADSPLSPALSPDPLRLIGPTIGSTPVGRFKRSGTGEKDYLLTACS